MKAIVSVIGHDTVGILAKVSGECAKYNANIIDVTQSVMKDIFTMIMLIDINELSADFADLASSLEKLGEDVLCFGCDIDGIEHYPEGFDSDSSMHDRLVDILLERYSEGVVEKIAGLNAINFFKGNL